jgi:ABC-type polysaccharide/polyol phosphate transport system ATPase subunit
MSDVAVQLDHLYKKFRKGETCDSLRDLIPALTGKLLRRGLRGTDKREFWALHDISFEVKRREAFGIIGHNGAGKSTMLKILGRIMRPTKGRIVVNGRLSALIEVSAGFHSDLTGRENIFLNGAILGMTKREIESKLDQIIDFSGIEEFIDTPVKRYSSGMYARLGFSVAAHVDPEILLVDEVLSVGDMAFQQRCVQKMQSIVQSGATVLFVSHNLKVMAEFCNRCLLLERGRAMALGGANEVIAGYVRRQNATHNEDSSKELTIAKVTVRNQDGECVRFQSGQKAWVDVVVCARKPCTKLSLSLYLSDSTGYLIFNTSLERLGYPSFDLQAGQLFRCTFELNLNLAVGTFHVSTLVFRYDTETEYDRWLQAATIFMTSDQDVRGIVNCFPRVVEREVCENQELPERLVESPG